MRPLGVPYEGSRLYYAVLSLILTLISEYCITHSQHAYLPNKGIGTAWLEIGKALGLGYTHVFE